MIERNIFFFVSDAFMYKQIFMENKVYMIENPLNGTNIPTCVIRKNVNGITFSTCRYKYFVFQELLQDENRYRFVDRSKLLLMLKMPC